MNYIGNEISRAGQSVSKPSLLKSKDGICAPCEWTGKTRNGINWYIYHGDAEKVLKKLEDDSVNCVITSPPYYWLRDYGVIGQIGLEETVDGYVESIRNVMREVKRVIKKDGVLFLNIGDTYYSGKGASHGTDRKSNKRRFGLRAVDKSGGLGIGIQRKSIIGIPWRVALAMVSDGWVLRSSIIWHREKCMPESTKDRPSRSYENVFMFVKNRKYYFNKKALIDQKVEEDMWTIPARPKIANGMDTAPYPDELVKRCIEIGCPASGVILDPFVGSGTTVRVAVQMKHPAIGIDLNKKFCKFTVDHLHNY